MKNSSLVHHAYFHSELTAYMHSYIQTSMQTHTLRGSEEILSMAQDLSRNRIITLNLLASTGAFIVASGSLVASVFGEPFCLFVFVYLCVYINI